MRIDKNFLVVSDYNWLPQNIEESWVHEYSDNYLIYDRFHRWDESDRIKRQKNVGQNIYDIFDFIITHYDSLPDTTLFCRSCIMFPKGRQKPLSNGNCGKEKFEYLMNNDTFTELHDFGPEAHCSCYKNNCQHWTRMEPDGGYLEINNSWYFSYHPGKYYNNLNSFLHDMYVNPVIPNYIRFAPGGNYIIPKSNILRYSKKFYERIREILEWDVVVGEAHMIERCLYTIFTCDWEVKEKYK